MKKFLFIFLLMNILSVPSLLAQTVRPTSFDNRDICEKDKGVWRQFGNGCVDSCRAQLDRFTICTMALTYGCDCGKGRCWEKGRCVDAKEFKIAYDKVLAQEEKKRQKQKEARKALYQKHRNSITNKLRRSATVDDLTAEKKQEVVRNKVEERRKPNNPSQPSPSSPIINFIADAVKDSDKKQETTTNKAAKKEFEIPSFFLKRQEAEKKAAAQKAKAEAQNAQNQNSQVQNSQTQNNQNTQPATPAVVPVEEKPKDAPLALPVIPLPQ